MIPRWLVDVLDRELPSMTGGQRDELAAKVLEALPVELIDRAIAESAEIQLRAHGIALGDREAMVRDVAGNAAMSVVGALAGVDDEEAEPTQGRTSSERDRARTRNPREGLRRRLPLELSPLREARRPLADVGRGRDEEGEGPRAQVPEGPRGVRAPKLCSIMAPLPPGRILENVTPDDYHQRDGFSSSVAKVVVAQSPLHAKFAHGRKPSKVLDFGNIGHRLILGEGEGLRGPRLRRLANEGLEGRRRGSSRSRPDPGSSEGLRTRRELSPRG
jgi:hypothetical protein